MLYAVIRPEINFLRDQKVIIENYIILMFVGRYLIIFVWEVKFGTEICRFLRAYLSNTDF